MNNGNSGAIRSPVYGPFEVIGELKADGRNVLGLPFADVAGANLLLAVADNFANIAVQGIPQGLFPGVEITIWGAVQSYEVCLRRVCVHMLSGPIQHLLEYAERWDQILIRAQNMCGGSLQNAGESPDITQANNYSLKVSVYISPRSGFTQPSETAGSYGRAG